MTLLAVYVTHLDPPSVLAGVENLVAGLPRDSRVIVAHGGHRDDFDALPFADKHFAEDRGLRGPAATHQSYNRILGSVHREHVISDVGVDAVLVVEFDQVVLRAGFGERLLQLLESSGADFLGKNCIDRTSTNWWHRVRYRDDPDLLRFLSAHSIREDPTRLFGCLGSGFLMRRAALEAFCSVDHLDGIYNELYIPTLVHHLGFRLADVDALSDLYRAVRWMPPYSVGEVRLLQREGVAVVHPFKELGQLDRLRAPASLGP